MAGVVIATGLVEPKIDEQKIADSLLLNYLDEERDWYSGISRLPIGARATLDRDGVKLDRYYDPARLPEIRLKNDNEYVEATTCLFEEAVRFALQDFSRPGIAISGGLNSQAVAAFTLKTLSSESVLNGYTSVPEGDWRGPDSPGTFGNERAYVEAFAAMYPQFRPHWIEAAGLGLDHRLTELFVLAGGPPRNAGNLHWIHEIWSQAKADGCDVILTGEAGNIAFSQAAEWSYARWFKRGQWLRLAKELRAARHDERTIFRKFVSLAIMPLFSDGMQRLARQIAGSPFPSSYGGWCPLNPDWAKKMHVEERAREMGFDPHFRIDPDPNTFRRTIGGGELGDLNQAFDEIHQIPERDPTSYRPMVEFCYSIPDDQFIRDGQSRWLARRVLKGLVPEVVRTERRYGRQAADWPFRLAREREKISSELESLERDPKMTGWLNISGLRDALAKWDSDNQIEQTELFGIGSRIAQSNCNNSLHTFCKRTEFFLEIQKWFSIGRP